MQRVFLTFAAGNQDYLNAANRLIGQAKETGWFSTVVTVDHRRLFDIDIHLGNRNRSFIQQNPRGYGYWIWKPFVIQLALQRLPEGTHLLYLDAGCELNPQGFERLCLLYDHLTDATLVAFQIDEDAAKWTKADTLKHLGIDPQSPQVHFKQLSGGNILIKNSIESRRFIGIWQSLCEFDNYSLLDDSPSKIPNHPSFKEHRHDQAIFSLLAQTFSFVRIVPDEFNHQPYWSKGQYPTDYPIHQLRNRTGTPRLPQMIPV